MEKDVFTRMGDGQRIKMSPAQIKEDLLAGTKDAADRGRIPELSADELGQLFEIIVDKNRAVSIESGNEIVFTDDCATLRICDDEGAGGGVGLPMGRTLALLVHERSYAQDSALLEAASVVNVPELKAELGTELQLIEQASLLLTIPLLYMITPALLWYFQPLGPYGNPADLLPQGKIQESRDALEGAAAALTDDVVYIGRRLPAVGVDCLNLDTAASSGDAELYGILKAVSKLKEVVPELAVEVGMSSEFVLGLHGQITFNGQRLAGMFPHQQVKVAEAAGVDIFGPVVNTNCSRSFPWNLARGITFVKQTVAASNIPIHANTGMGVGGVPMCPVPPIDCVSRVSKAMAQVAKVDGL